jgi:spore germination protein
MIIHVVESGETINSIADQYGVSAERLLLDNGKYNTGRLVVGEALEYGV